MGFLRHPTNTQNRNTKPKIKTEIKKNNNNNKTYQWGDLERGLSEIVLYNIWIMSKTNWK